MVALTATAGPSNRRKIFNQLSFSSNAKIVVESPDRLNIKISSKCISNNDQFENVFSRLIFDLTALKEKMSCHDIFCESISEVSKLYVAFVKIFGANCELINMYHSKTNKKLKEKIRADMAVDGKIRILICNNSAGIGVNFFGLNNIVHYGSPGKLTLLCNRWGDVVEMECCQMNPYY